jgi:quinol monooxygenase YgiN
VELFIFARFHARPGQEGAVAEALVECIVPTRAEPGCLSGQVFTGAGLAGSHDPVHR